MSEKYEVTLPSFFNIDEEVIIDFGSNNIIKGAVICGVLFTEDKTYYSVRVNVDNNEYTVISNIDSFFFKKIDL